MSPLQEVFSQYFGPILLLIALAVGLTIYLFRRRRLDRGYRKGTAANPKAVKRDNPPDQWSNNH